MNREQQKLRIDRIRRAIIAGSAAGSLAVAGYLGLSAQGASATATDTTDIGTTAQDATTDPDGFSTQFGDNSTQLSTGSGTSHAVTSGS